MASSQIWNIEQRKDREKEKVGGRPAKFNEKKGNRDLEIERGREREREGEKEKETFNCWTENNMKIVFRR